MARTSTSDDRTAKPRKATNPAPQKPEVKLTKLGLPQKKRGPKPGTLRKKSAARRPAPTFVAPPQPTAKLTVPRPPPTVTVRDVHLNTSTNAAAALVDENKPLTEMQRFFVREWAKGESIRTASARAGYGAGDTFAYRMTKMPNVLKLYHEEKAKYEAAAQMSRKKVMDMLVEAYDMAKLMSEPASMVSAAREVGRMCGYYEPSKHQIDVNVTGDVTVRQLNSMSDADLLKILQSGPSSTPLLERVEEITQGDDDAPDDEAAA
jgi:hypothetical protein